MRRLMRTYLLVCILAGNIIAHAAESVYIDSSADGSAPTGLQSEPIPISGHPTVLSMASTVESMRLRAVDVNGEVRQWSMGSLEQPEVLFRLGEQPVCAILSADAKWLASSDTNGVVTVTNIESGKTVFRDGDTEENTMALRFSRDARRLGGVTSGGVVRVWETRSGRLTDRFEVTPGALQSLSFAGNGELLAVASFGREVVVFGLGHATTQTISIDRARITATAFTPDSKQMVIAAADGTMRIVELGEQEMPRALANHPFAVWTLAFDDHDRLAAGSWDGMIRLFDTRSWKVIQSVKTHQESICALQLGTQGMVAAGIDGRLFYWPPELAAKPQRGSISGSNEPVWVAAYSPNGSQLYVGGSGKRSELWDLESKQRRGTGPLHPTVRCATYSPDGQLLATGGDDTNIVIASTRDGTVRHRLSGHPGLVSALVFVDDGQTLVSGCDRGLLKFWDVRTGTEVASRKRHKQQLYCLAVSPDEKWLVTGGGHWAKGDPGELIVWNLKRRRFETMLEGHSLTVWSIVFAPDGSYFATSDSAGDVKIWNTETHELERTLKHQAWLRPLAISPDGTTLAAGRGDGSIRLWDTRTWKQRAVCNGHDGFTFWLTYSPDGATLVSGGNDGTVRFWPTE